MGKTVAEIIMVILAFYLIKNEFLRFGYAKKDYG
jgi:hypothetical protein